MASNLLTDAIIKALKPTDKVQRHSDGNGLSLIVKPNGSKLWRARFFIEGQEKNMSLGDYREVSLAKARDKNRDARTQVADEVNPIIVRQDKKRTFDFTLKSVTLMWLEKYSQEVDEKTFQRSKVRFEKWVFPRLGSRPIANITVVEVVQVLKAIQAHGEIDTSYRTKRELSRVFCFATSLPGLEKFTNNPVALIGKDALVKRTKTKNHARLTNPMEFGAVLRAIDGYQGQPIIELALKLTPHVALRPVELRSGRWSEIDWKRSVWRIPAERMKMRREHLVPLSRQVLAMLRELQQHTGTQKLMFPTMKDPTRPLSENTINACLRRMGYDTQTQQSAHGFRGSFSTMMNELQPEQRQAIEVQIAHAKVGAEAHYNSADLLPQRKVLVQAWSDYIDELREEGKVKSASSKKRHLHLVAG